MIFKRELLIIFLITLLGFSIRIWGITSSPSSLYIDETDIGYNAFSLITNGRDEHGRFLPLFFESFGDWKPPLYIYEVALAQLFLGPTDFSVRIPAVIIGSLTIPIFFLLAKELFRNHKGHNLYNYAPILSAFLLATSPWHIQFTRAGFGACLVIFFYSLALLLFFKAIQKKSTLILAVSMVTFSLTIYSYYSPRLITPIIILLLIILYHHKFNLKSWVIAIAVFALLAYPALVFSLTPEGSARARMVSIFYNPTQYPKIVQFFVNYLANISPYRLFVYGDPTIAHLTPHRMSLIHIVEFPFVALGLLILFLMKSRNFFLIILLFFIGFIPPAITITHPHALRGIIVLLGSIFVSAFGFNYVLLLIKNKNLQKFLLGLYLFSIIILTLRFLNIYHNKYVIDAGWDWQVGIKRAVNRVIEIENNYGDIYFDVDPRLIPVVWYLKINPNFYQNSLNKNHLGKYHINESISSPHGLYVGLNPPKGNLLEYIYYPNNSVAYGIWEF